MLQDPALLAINGFAVPAAKLAEKRKLIEEIAHNDVKKVRIYYQCCPHFKIFNFCECFGEKASKQADQFVFSYFNLSSNF